MRTAIVGVGMAGLACAERLAGRGHVLTLLDKGRGPGGRMSTRRVATEAGEANFDHGAQYFTVRDPGFRTRVDAWVATGCVAPWVAAGAEAFVGVPGMNAPTDGGQESLSLALDPSRSPGPPLTLIALILPGRPRIAMWTAPAATSAVVQFCWCCYFSFVTPLAVRKVWRRLGDVVAVRGSL